jgi:hypothetical protein
MPLTSSDRSISTPFLEVNVSLWKTADYFLLKILKNGIQEYLLNRIAATLLVFHRFQITPWFTPYDQFRHDGKLQIVLADLTQAVRKAYEHPSAREVHQLLAILACGLREHLPEQILWDLMNIPGFQKDITTVLIVLHFTQSTNGSVADKLGVCYHQTSKTRQCSVSDCESGYLAESSESRFMTLDPFSLATRRWCDTHAFSSIQERLKAMINAWPKDAVLEGILPAN